MTAALTLHSPVEPLFGLTVTLTGRTHKELAGSPPQVVGIWEFELNRGGKTITAGFTGDSLHLEGAGLGATWVLDGPYDEERITVWPGETAPISEEAAIALARAELGAQAPPPGDPWIKSRQGGTLMVSFGRGPRAIQVLVGLYSKRAMALENP